MKNMASLEETIKENFRYGITDMLILKLLTEEDKYVYQITGSGRKVKWRFQGKQGFFIYSAEQDGAAAFCGRV